MVGPVFESEARMHLNEFLGSSLPGSVSLVRNRTIDDFGQGCQLDAFAYTTDENTNAAQPIPGAGIAIVPRVNDANPQPCHEQKLSHSPNVTSVVPPLTFTAEKYFIAEAYSGTKEREMKNKVKELQDKLQLMKDRYESLHEPITDITSIVSSAALVFVSGTQSRADALRAAVALVADEVRGRALLKPLRDAGRLLVVVLCSTGEPKNNICASSVFFLF
jgi:hypothetical protein